MRCLLVCATVLALVAMATASDLPNNGPCQVTAAKTFFNDDTASCTFCPAAKDNHESKGLVNMYACGENTTCESPDVKCIQRQSVSSSSGMSGFANCLCSKQ